MKITPLILLVSVVSLASCKGDDAKKANLNGNWLLKYAELNGQPAPSLDRIHFNFNEGNLTTNFNEATSDETSTFELKKEKLIKNSQPQVEFDIENQTDSSLELKTEMRGFDFKLILKREVLNGQ
jgi:hypothetical protein